MKLVKNAEQFVTELFKKVLEFKYKYHDVNHTKNVVHAVRQIGEYEGVSEEDLELLQVAAWFHDTGYIKTKDGHEEESTRIASSFLRDNHVPEEKIEVINRLIMATVFNHTPKDLLEKIICDADYYHVGSCDYFSFLKELRTEWKLCNVAVFTEKEWLKENISFLKSKHTFYTDYAKNNWNKVKQQNLNILEEKKEENGTIAQTEATVTKPKKKKKKKLGRGVETLFRVTITNHTRLSDIADSKANILLSVNAIIISVALSVLIPKLDSPGNAYLTLPTFVLLFFSVISIVFAILATRPKVTSTEFTKEDILNKKVNLLFFGNFYKVPYQDYEDEINKMMVDNDYLYNSLTKDLHYLGIILDRKYKLLRITYNIFMVGIVISVLTFLYAYQHS
ncbi:Pycsar system effector family protein [Flavobacterium sp. J27]|uniref:Pycsar system effector family protein n=1 Tax=Flavobacterium sp. J27 TaxID=2060419 RepID=UPI001031077B|nr:Pycsar system effector family protein [Flavobacterium sp. J27]